MNRDLLLELRILSGTHAGARALLGEGPYTLGSDTDCDFVLSDAGIAPAHVRVECDPVGGAILHWLESGDGTPQHVGRGEGVCVGPVVITVDNAGAEWPFEALPMPAMSAHDAADDEALPTAAPLPLSADAKPTKANAADRRLDGRALTAFAAVALASMGCLWWALHEVPASEMETPSAPLSSQAAVVEVQKAEILSIVAQLGMASRVAVAPARGDRGRLEVRAHMLSESEAEILAAAMVGLVPHPSLRVVNEQELTLAVDEAVKRHADRLQTRLTARHVGAGRFRIEGSLTDLAQRKDVLDALGAEFPGLPAFQDGFRDKAELARVMVRELRSQGIREIESSWQDGLLALKVRISAADVPRWEQALREVASRYDVPFKASLDLSGNPTPMIVALPLHIRSVVSGDVPYLVLANGDKLFVDGRRNGWRLVGIDSNSVVFEGPQARRVVVNR